MNKTIYFYCKCNYGTNHLYLATRNADEQKMARAISNLTMTTTLAERHMHALVDLGFTFVEIIAPR